MPAPARATLLPALICLVLIGATGCVKLRQTLTLMPDGAGKVEMRFGLNEQLVQLSKQSDEDPFKEVIPDIMNDKCRGVVAFTEPVRSKEGDFTYMAYTVYFRDINRLRITGLGEARPAEYDYRRTGDTATLTVSHGTTLSMISKHETTPEPQRDGIRQGMKGLMLSEHFVLPGKVDAVEGLTTEANTAKLDLSLENLLENTGPIEVLKGVDTISMRITAIETDAAATKAFAEELEAAVADWEKRREEAQAE